MGLIENCYQCKHPINDHYITDNDHIDRVLIYISINCEICYTCDLRWNANITIPRSVFESPKNIVTKQELLKKISKTREILWD
jgi:hypothetical protein